MPVPLPPLGWRAGAPSTVAACPRRSFDHRSWLVTKVGKAIDRFQPLRHGRGVRRDSLFFHRDFRLLWLGDTVSQFGSIVTMTAAPLLAALVLAAAPFGMGLLNGPAPRRSCRTDSLP